MARLVWDAVGTHFYETGVSHGVLYLGVTQGTTHELSYPAGVVWNGLTSVSESPDGGDAEDFYADNIKYLTLRGVENLTGSINAYTYPDEFMECDGSRAFSSTLPGVYLHQQTRRTFGLSYITNIGSDAMEDAGVMYHLLYGLTVSPSDREYSTVNDSPEPIEFSWDFSAQPVPISTSGGMGTPFKSTSLITIDSRKITAAQKTLLENHLWGTPASETEAIAAHLPFPDEVYTILASVT